MLKHEMNRNEFKEFMLLSDDQLKLYEHLMDYHFGHPYYDLAKEVVIKHKVEARGLCIVLFVIKWKMKIKTNPEIFFRHISIGLDRGMGYEYCANEYIKHTTHAQTHSYQGAVKERG